MPLALGVLAVMLLAACGDGREVGDAEAMLAEHYLKPLDKAGIHATVESTCRYKTPVDGPWHLSVELRLDAERDRVAEVLKGKGVVVVSDHDPRIVQQWRDSMEGWNGGLEASGGGALLTLVFNNATRSDRFSALGWAEECPEV